MQEDSPDLELEALSDETLLDKLSKTDWRNEPDYMSDEQVFRLFRCARQQGSRGRAEFLSNVLSERLLRRSRQFARKACIYPGLIGNLDDASHEIASEVWNCLLTKEKDAIHAERAFGQLFKRRAIDFQRKLMTNKRLKQVNIEAMSLQSDDSSAELTTEDMLNSANPEDIVSSRQYCEQQIRKLQTLLTANEYITLVMLFSKEMQVKEIASALGVTTRAINYYKNSALKKIQEET